MSSLRSSLRIALALFFALLLTASTAMATNLLTNYDFDTDTTDWADRYPDAGLIISHDTTKDHDDTPGTVGSLKVERSNASGGYDGPAHPCVAVTPGATYLAAAAIFRPTQTLKPNSYIHLQYFESEDCTGPSYGSYGDGANWMAWEIDDEWYDLSFDATIPATVSSAQFVLMSGGTLDDLTFTTLYFDNVYLPEPASTSLAAAALVTLLLLGHRKDK